MTLKKNSFDGQTNGATVTFASTATSGDQTAIATTGTIAVTYTTAQAAHGSSCVSIAAPATTDSGALYFYGYTAASIAGRAYFRFSAVPSAATEIVSIYGSGGGEIGRIFVNSNGTVRIDDATGAQVFASTTALAANTWYRVETALAVGASTTTGTLKLAVYTLDSATVLGDITYSSTARNTGAAGSTISNIQWGKPANNAWLGTTFVDDVAANDGTTTFIGPYTVATNTAPTVTPGSAQTVTGTTASLSGSATTSTGTMSSAVWSLLSTTAGSNPTVGSTTNTGGGGATITAAASPTGLTAKSTNVFRLTATNSGGAVSTGDVTVYVSGTPVAPNRVISNAGGWVAVNAASLQVAVNKATDDDTSYVETPATPSAASVIFGLEPIALGDETITIRLRYTGTGTFTCIPKLYSGSTLITTAAAPITLTGAFANYTIPLSTSENAAVANRNDIRVELVATQS